MSIYAIIYIALCSASLLLHAHKHGKPRTGNYSFWIALTTLSIQVALLYFGGFFESPVK